MDQVEATSSYAIHYAKDDPIVKRCLEKSSLYRTLGWMQLGMFLLIALFGIIQSSVAYGSLAAMMGVCSAFSWIAELGHRKSAWIRTLELRLEELERAN